jgi:hypothetical protein
LKEKEVMQTIFEREFRREKNLEIMKKLANDAKPTAAKEKQKNIEKMQLEKEIAAKQRLTEIEEKFFVHVSKDGEDIEVIKARGEMSKANADESNAFAKSDVKIQLVNLEPNKNYTFKIDKVGDFPFVCEAGGIIAGENVNG